MTTIMGAENAFGSLLFEVITMHRLVVIEYDELHRALDLEPNSAMTDLVANVSPREIRIWCQLNTLQVHQELFAVGRSSEDRKRFHSESSPGPCCDTKADVIIAVQVPQVLDCEAVPVSEEFFRKIKLPDGSCAKMTSAAPWIFFACCGPSHRVICVGASRERLLWWPELGKLRDEARSNLVGLEAAEQWERRLEALIDLEQQDTNDRQAMTKGRRGEIRKAVMSRAQQMLSLRHDRNARSLLANPLRQCQGHLGQAYGVQRPRLQGQRLWHSGMLLSLQDGHRLSRSRGRRLG